MTSLEVGEAPDPLTVTLVQGEDFRKSLRRADGSFWPEGCSIRFAFGDDNFIWYAQFSTTDAVWDVEAKFVEEVIDSNLRRVSLVYRAPSGLERVTHRGQVFVR